MPKDPFIRENTTSAEGLGMSDEHGPSGSDAEARQVANLFGAVGIWHLFSWSFWAFT